MTSMSHMRQFPGFDEDEDDEALKVTVYNDKIDIVQSTVGDIDQLSESGVASEELAPPKTIRRQSSVNFADEVEDSGTTSREDKFEDSRTDRIADEPDLASSHPVTSSYPVHAEELLPEHVHNQAKLPSNPSQDSDLIAYNRLIHQSSVQSNADSVCQGAHLPANPSQDSDLIVHNRLCHEMSTFSDEAGHGTSVGPPNGNPNGHANGPPTGPDGPPSHVVSAPSFDSDIQVFRELLHTFQEAEPSTQVEIHHRFDSAASFPSPERIQRPRSEATEEEVAVEDELAVPKERVEQSPMTERPGPPDPSPVHYPNEEGWDRGARSRAGSARSIQMLRERCSAKTENCSCDPRMTSELDRTGKSALHYCAENQNINCIDEIICADPSLVNLRDEEGYTPLHLAVISGNKAIAKYLISKGADVNAVDNELHSAVHWATVCGELESLDVLIEEGALPATADIHGAYPLHYAAQMCGSHSELGIDGKLGLSVLRRLISHGVDVTVQDRDGRQPLLWAASSGSTDAILSLVNAGSEVEGTDKDGLTALHCAASRGHHDCLETLITLCGAEVDVIDNNGSSALFYAVTLGHADCAELLLNNGADPNRQDRKGRSPAHCGCGKGQIETIRILCNHGGNLWIANARGDVPLHDAVQSGRKDLIRWLLAQRPEAVDYSNNDGRCPLHIAAINNGVELCKILIDHGAFVNPIMRNSKGHLMTPLDAALYKGNRGCAKYIQLHGGVPASKLTDKTALQKALSRAITEKQSSKSDFVKSTPPPPTVSKKVPIQAEDKSVQAADSPSPVPPVSSSPVPPVSPTPVSPVNLPVSSISNLRVISREPTRSGSSAGPSPITVLNFSQRPAVETQTEDPDAETRETQTTFPDDVAVATEDRALQTSEPSDHGDDVNEADDRLLDDHTVSNPNDDIANGDPNLDNGLTDPIANDVIPNGITDPPEDELHRLTKDVDSERGSSTLHPVSSRTTESTYKDSGYGEDEKLTPESFDDQLNGNPHHKREEAYETDYSDYSNDENRGFNHGRHKNGRISSSPQRRRRISEDYRRPRDSNGDYHRRPMTSDGLVETVSVTRAMQNSMRKYQVERRIFAELLELKKLQIRAGRANEHILVKRLADTYAKTIRDAVGLRPHDGPWTFREYERYLYTQLRTLQHSQPNLLPRFKHPDDLDRLTLALKRHGIDGSNLKQAYEGDAKLCTHSSHRCHHAANAYVGGGIGGRRSKRELILPRIDTGRRDRPDRSTTRRPLIPKEPLRLELHHGEQKQAFQLPTEKLDKSKKYYVTFTINPGEGKAMTNGEGAEVATEAAMAIEEEKGE